MIVSLNSLKNGYKTQNLKKTPTFVPNKIGTWQRI